MEPDSIQRVEQDLQTIRQAAGIELPFGRRDIQLALLLAGTFLAISVMSLLVEGRWLLASVVPLVLLAAASVWLLRRYGKRGGVLRREYTFQKHWLLIQIVGIVLYTIAGIRLGIDRPLIYATIGYFSGISLLVVGLSSAARRHLLAAALGMFAMVPIFCTLHEHPLLIPVLCGVAALTVLGDAAIMTIQLRNARAAV